MAAARYSRLADNHGHDAGGHDRHLDGLDRVVHRGRGQVALGDAVDVLLPGLQTAHGEEDYSPV